MLRCLELAKMGQGNVAPNPMVGSVIVYDGKIIGEGYHQKYGFEHAEVNAILSVEDESLLKSSTIYVNLEPCAHQGKTPPCADLIVKKNIKKVVIGCVDPFAQVAGKGIKRLKNAGIEVVTNVLEKECIRINRRFFKFHMSKRPYVILKWAQSANGLMDIDRNDSEKGIHWITQPETKSLVHQWRSEEAGILVGRNTINIDNPELTCRNVSGANPIRIIIDKRAKLRVQNYNIGSSEAETIILNNRKTDQIDTNRWIEVEPFNLSEILSILYLEGTQSILVEGGQKTLNSFIVEGLWDEARVLTGTKDISSGLKAPALYHVPKHSYHFGQDLVSIYEN